MFSLAGGRGNPPLQYDIKQQNVGAICESPVNKNANFAKKCRGGVPPPPVAFYLTLFMLFFKFCKKTHFLHIKTLSNAIFCVKILNILCFLQKLSYNFLHMKGNF